MNDLAHSYYMENLDRIQAELESTMDAMKQVALDIFTHGQTRQELHIQDKLQNA